MEKRAENCHIYGKGCGMENYNVSLWRKQIFPHFPDYHFFYDGYELIEDPGALRDPQRALKEYLTPYLNEKIWKPEDPAVSCEVIESDFYLDKCCNCSRQTQHSSNCKKSFILTIRIKLALQPGFYCSQGSDYSLPCSTCRMNPLKRTEIAKKHKRNKKNLCTMRISDFRLGGHAVKVEIEFIKYRCVQRSYAIRTLPFLFGDSTDMTRVSKRLASYISKDLLNGRGPTFISEACAIPINTIKGWRRREQELCRKHAELAKAKGVFAQPDMSIIVRPMKRFMSIITPSRSNAFELAMPRLYTKQEYHSMDRFIKQSLSIPKVSYLEYAHIFLLSYDCFAANGYRAPLVRAILICFCYAAQKPSPSAEAFDLFAAFIDQCGAEANRVFHRIKQCFANALDKSWDSFPLEFYRDLAVRNDYQETLWDEDPLAMWWDVYSENVDTPAPSTGLLEELVFENQELLRRIDQLCAESEFSPKETVVLLTAYNPFLLIDYYTCPREMFLPEDESGAVDFSQVKPGGVPLEMLEKMLRAGLLKMENTRPLPDAYFAS